MKIIEINEAEAIIEPFFDGGTSDYTDPDPRYRVLDEYEVQALNGAVARAEQAWAFANLSVDRTVPGKPVLQLRRRCDIDLTDYDTFILFGSLPKDFRLWVDAEIDGRVQRLLDGVAGSGSSDEYTAPFAGKRMAALTITIASLSDGIEGNLCWLGLAHSGRLEQMLSRKPQYPADWPGCFAQNPPATPVPDIGILLGEKELPALREKLKKPPFAAVYQQKKEQAVRDMAICPESYIGRFVPHYDRRWNRSRDKAWAPDLSQNACGMHTAIENLAFVGMVEGNVEMLRMAARHALSVAHCEYWCESPMGVLPGATWHHRSFTENIYCKTVALVLDWCGQLLTPFAKQILRDALAMKGLPRIESDFRRVEYIRHMNQGIVFSYGRVFAQLALLPRYPRYARDLEQSEADLKEMIASYVQSDGGVLEGPGYWMFTFNEVLPAFYALARMHGQPFTCYRDIFAGTGGFELSMLSVEDDSTVLHPVNDAHPCTHVSCALAGSFFQFTGDMAWKDLYERLLAQGQMDKDTFALIACPLPDGRVSGEDHISRIFPVTGQLGSLRTGKDLLTRVHLCTGPTYPTHFHADKGSLLLEAGGYTLCPDCGSANYFESELFYLRHARSHSLLYPMRADGVLSVQGRDERGGTVLHAAEYEGAIDFASDDTAAWSDGVYKNVQRRVLSAFAELAVVEDTFQLGQADHVEFLLNCFGEWKLEKGQAVARVGDVTLRVVPLNWQWSEPYVRNLQDGEHRPVWQLCAPYTAARAGRLLTALCMEKKMQVEIRPCEGGWKFVHGEKTVCLQENQRQAEWQSI